PSPKDIFRTRLATGPGGVTINIRYYWPPPPGGVGAGYTAPLARFVDTTITGYTSRPIVLQGYYSQTYRPEHHKFGEHFLFEPGLGQGLDHGLDADLLAEMRARNSRLMHVNAGYAQTTITTYGFTAPGDFNHTGHVDALDLEHFLSCHAAEQL